MTCFPFWNGFNWVVGHSSSFLNPCDWLTDSLCDCVCVSQPRNIFALHINIWCEQCAPCSLCHMTSVQYLMITVWTSFTIATSSTSVSSPDSAIVYICHHCHSCYFLSIYTVIAGSFVYSFCYSGNHPTLQGRTLPMVARPRRWRFAFWKAKDSLCVCWQEGAWCPAWSECYTLVNMRSEPLCSFHRGALQSSGSESEPPPIMSHLVVCNQPSFPLICFPTQPLPAFLKNLGISIWFRQYMTQYPLVFCKTSFHSVDKNNWFSISVIIVIIIVVYIRCTKSVS